MLTTHLYDKLPNHIVTMYALTMKILSIICQKGGTAKTTAAINLAVEATNRGFSVVIIDLDPQVSACSWKDVRGDRTPDVAPVPVPHLDRTLTSLRQAGADLAIIDTAGRANDSAMAAARVADLVLMPVQPSLADLNTVDATLDIVRLAGGRSVVALLSRVRTAGSRHADTTAWLDAKGVAVCPVMLGERVVYQDAYAQGLSVGEVEPKGQAAAEIRNLFDHLSGLLGLTKTGA